MSESLSEYVLLTWMQPCCPLQGLVPMGHWQNRYLYSLQNNGQAFLGGPVISIYEGLISVCKDQQSQLPALGCLQPQIVLLQTSHPDQLIPPAVLYLINTLRFPVAGSGPPPYPSFTVMCLFVLSSFPHCPLLVFQDSSHTDPNTACSF